MTQNRNILGREKTLEQLLFNKEYSIDYYQREYKWGERQIGELITDFENKFSNDYEDDDKRKDVQNYQPYFLGSIILVNKDNQTFIIDGQQRLTSLTLLLIFLYRHLTNDEDKANILKYILSTQYGEQTFNLNIPSRKDCIQKLYKEGTYEINENDDESVANLVERYENIEDQFPPSILNDEKKLSMFVDWLQKKLVFVEIITGSDQDAYTIFETMNDRGLSLNNSEMLKGYLLSQIHSSDQRNKANSKWKNTVEKLIKSHKKHEEDYVKAWLRGKYANSIRERKKGAEDKDFEIIGNAFHRWVRNNKDDLLLGDSNEYYNFISEKYVRYSRYYLKILECSEKFNSKYETLFYNFYNKLTLQNSVILAPLNDSDTEDIVDKKIRMVSRYLDIYLVRRFVNYKAINYNTLVVGLFSLIKKIRNKNLEDLKEVLIQELNNQKEKISEIVNLKLTKSLNRKIRFLLSRFAYFIDREMGVTGADFGKYIRIKGERKPFEIEHIFSNNYDDYRDVFPNEEEFKNKRNSIGALILLPRGENQSYGNLPYKEKVQHYVGGNILAKSLTKKCYEHNPSFTTFVNDNNLNFKSYDKFTQENLNERTGLYKQLAELIWSEKNIENEMKS